MIWPQLQTVGETAISRILNSLPEGVLIALFAGLMLRILPRQNSGTRFAVWFVALLAVAGLPFIGAGTGVHSVFAAGGERPLITLVGPWGMVLFLAWIGAVCFALFRLTTGLWHLRQLRKSCVAIDKGELPPEIRQTITDFSSTKSVTLVTSDCLSVPAVVGFLNPVIVLPSWTLQELAPDELKVILLHEFAHVRRWDAWTNLLQKIVRAVFLFHPAVWWIDQRLSLEREMACDDQVLAQTANPRGYAKCLVALLERSVERRGWAMAHAVVHRAREASLRLAQILDAGRPSTKNVWKPALALVGSFSVLCLMVVPRAPQLVAFERSAQAAKSSEKNSVQIRRTPVSAAAVIPAVMHASPSTRFKKKPLARVVQVARDRERPLPDPQVIVAEWSADTERNPVEPVAVRMNRSVPQASEALFIIQTTQRIGPNAWVWSVGVWRVTLVNALPNGPGRVPLPGRT